MPVLYKQITPDKYLILKLNMKLTTTKQVIIDHIKETLEQMNVTKDCYLHFQKILQCLEGKCA